MPVAGALVLRAAAGSSSLRWWTRRARRQAVQPDLESHGAWRHEPAARARAAFHAESTSRRASTPRSGRSCAAAARINGGCRRRRAAPTATEARRGGRDVRPAMRRLLTARAITRVSMDADSLACDPAFCGWARGTWRSARAMASVAKGPAPPAALPAGVRRRLLARNTTAREFAGDEGGRSTLEHVHADGARVVGTSGSIAEPRFMKQAARAHCPCATAARSGPPRLGACPTRADEMKRARGGGARGPPSTRRRGRTRRSGGRTSARGWAEHVERAAARLVVLLDDLCVLLNLGQGRAAESALRPHRPRRCAGNRRGRAARAAGGRSHASAWKRCARASRNQRATKSRAVAARARRRRGRTRRRARHRSRPRRRLRPSVADQGDDRRRTRARLAGWRISPLEPIACASLRLVASRKTKPRRSSATQTFAPTTSCGRVDGRRASDDAPASGAARGGDSGGTRAGERRS